MPTTRRFLLVGLLQLIVVQLAAQEVKVEPAEEELQRSSAEEQARAREIYDAYKAADVRPGVCHYVWSFLQHSPGKYSRFYSSSRKVTPISPNAS
jgi:hypothetical protein